MTYADRGRAHLETLLGRAEKIVRISPSDTLVLMGVSDVQDPQEFAPTAELLEIEGVQAAGVLVLGEGLSLDSVDMHELHNAWLASQEVEEGQELKIVGQVELSEVMASCPRCNDKIPVPVTVMIGDDGRLMHARVITEQTDLAAHEILCPGSKNADV